VSAAKGAGAARWSIYLLRCGDDSLYCGVAIDVRARLAAHRAGKGARYTRGRGPLSLAARAKVGERGDALSVERSVKRLSRSEKLALIAPGALRAFVRASLRRRAARDERR
jgi:putative endonuclease